MSHLTTEQMTALLDGALDGEARSRAERHLGACGQCRDALAALEAQDTALRAALEHDPGEEYFADFAARVGGRIRAAGFQGAQERFEGRGLAGWFRSPRKLALIGSMAAVVVGAGIVMIVSREDRIPAIPEREIAARPPREASAGRTLAVPQPLAQAPPVERTAPPSGPSAAKMVAVPRPGAGAAAPSARAYEVRRDVSGEDVPVGRPQDFVRRPPSRATPPAAPGEPVHAAKQQYALPAAPAPEAGTPPRGGVRPVPATEGVASAEREESAPPPAAALAPKAEADQKAARSTSRALTDRVSRICGRILDDAGRPIAGAQVADQASGASARSGADGSFCLEAEGPAPRLAVMAVGFEPRWQTVRSGARADIVLAAVPVLGRSPQAASRALDRDARLLSRSPAPGGSPTLSFRGGDTFLRIRGTNALRLTALAEQVGTATAWDSAATEWQRVLDGVLRTPQEDPVRFQIARARYAAWRVNPSATRAGQVRAALGDYLTRASAGAERDTALSWREALGR